MNTPESGRLDPHTARAEAVKIHQLQESIDAGLFGVNFSPTDLYRDHCTFALDSRWIGLRLTADEIALDSFGIKLALHYRPNPPFGYGHFLYIATRSENLELWFDQSGDYQKRACRPTNPNLLALPYIIDKKNSLVTPIGEPWQMFKEGQPSEMTTADLELATTTLNRLRSLIGII